LVGTLAAALVALAGPATAAADNIYVALGDSVGAGFGASPGHSYFDLYCSYLESAAGGSMADKCVNESQPGATTHSALDGGMVDRAVTAIESSTNTPVVTIILGGNDLLGSPGCQPITASGCPFTANAGMILDRLDTALSARPGPHRIEWLEYYNSNHDNPFGNASEDASTAGLLLGSDLAIGDCGSETPAEIGLNDAINCVSVDKGAIPVDAYDRFQSACAALVCFSDALHPDDTGYALIFDAFRDAAQRPVPPAPPQLATLSVPAETKKAFQASHRHFKGGTVFSFRLDMRAMITIAIKRLSTGRLVGHRCRPDTPQLAKKPRCARTIAVGKLTDRGHPGPNRLAFNGRIRGRALVPGRYLAALSAADAAGSSPVQRLRFRIERPRPR
jgi:lysophospholipase L1-like esterase